MSSVAPLVPRRPKLDGGITFAQAMEAHRLFNEGSLAVPTVAYRMGIDYGVMCNVLFGKHWPAARDRWSGSPQ